ncbi:MAG: dihydrolipoyl dehydrogenase [Candidatus Omnitrophica bacterium]|nr:dihydrolipoyl dehydrogenase [Candidatus Omnitrophota bacterium]
MYDLAIIGSGWAGSNAALTAKAKGLKVCIIEKSLVGGTCLNRGCIPTKALIHSAKIYVSLKKAGNFGVELKGQAGLNFTAVQQRKEKVVEQLSRGMEFMLKGIDFIKGQAEIISNKAIKVGNETIETKAILIACGSRPAELASFKFDGARIISSDELINIKNIPSSLLIVGGGVIGCEFASLFSDLGSNVAVVELMPQLLPGEDKEIAGKLFNIFTRKSIKVNLNTSVKAEETGAYELVLVCVGRRPDTSGLGLEKLGIKLEKGKVEVDEFLRTNIPGIYAAGDCTGKIMLAHFAAYQGNVAAENIADPDNPVKIDSDNVPGGIFTDPEIASVGLTEEAAKAKGLPAKVNKFDFLGLGMARILDETQGFIKIVSHDKTGALLGAQIIGPRAVELIGVFSLAIRNKQTVAQLKNAIFPHPSISEAISEALK